MISEVLRKAMDSSGLSNAELSRAAGITPATMSRYRRGLHVLRLDTADKLAEALRLELRPRRKN